MRKYEKNQCADMLRTLEEAHGEIGKLIAKKDNENIFILLEQCQQAAVAIGEMIEKAEGEGTEAVSRLEGYCEYLYEIHESLNNGEKLNAHKTEKKLQKIINGIQASINTLTTRIEAVFLPYKASMWDSLESIWMAAEADQNCDAYVIPIPYYDKNPDGSIAKLNYEASLYPDYVPVTDYNVYKFEERHPDIIFIHNPYDEYNFVTTVHPYFYSKNLREMTDCLVYVPYYATSGEMHEGQSLCSAYVYADYIVVQSENMINQFDSRVPKEKFLPLGSPKFDRVIRLCNNPPKPSDEWKKKMEGKRVYFYNTSINGCLDDTISFFKKMVYVFSVFKDRGDACLLWRPHPLFESTIESMRPELLPEYLRLKESFIEEGVGILDETADIENTIALCDAYIGDAGTSIISLFGVAGKPIYILNNFLHEAPGEDDWLAWTTVPCRGDRNNRYAINMGNRLFVDRNGERDYRYLCDLSDEYGGGGYYSQVVEAEGKIVVFPANAEHILLINPDTLIREKINIQHRVARTGAFSGAFNMPLSENPDTFYIMPNRYPDMVSFDIRTRQMKFYKDEAFDDGFSVYENSLQERILALRIPYLDEGNCFSTEMNKNHPCRINKTERIFTAPDGTEHSYFKIRNPKIKGISLKDPKLLCIDVTGKRLRVIQLESGEAEEREIGLDGMYTAALRDLYNLDVYWFIPYNGTKLCKWTLSKDTFEHVDVSIEGLKSIRRPQRYECDYNYFSNGVFYENKLILSPRWGNKFVELDVNTYEAREWIPPFSFTTEDKNDYWKNGGIGFFIIDAFDWSYKYYYAPEHILYDIDLDNNSATAAATTFDKEDVYDLAAGFHRESQWLPYCCFEDVFNPLADFIDGNIHGSAFEKERQTEAYRAVNASPDGDCGEKIYRTIIEQRQSNIKE